MDNEYKFLKSVSLNELPREAWQFITGGDTTSGDIGNYMRSIPWMFRGVDIRSNAITNIPFVIMKGDDIFDDSENWENKLGFMPHPQQLFGLIEASLTIFGYSYLFKEQSAFKNKNLRYLLPTTVKPKINEQTGEIKFTRTINGKPAQYTPDDIVYLWKPDPFVELGPPTASPAMAAANACGVLLNVDLFASQFFKQGAVKTTLLTTQNIMPAERDRLKSWWKRVLGMDRAWQTDIINAEKIEPVQIGEGLESLQNNDLTEAKRIDIAASLGIPYSVLFSNASNRATAEQDDLHLYDKTIIPEANFIQATLNEQVLEPLGYKLQFQPDQMSIYQKDENERAQSLIHLINALEKPEEFLLASKILGYDIDLETLAEIEAMIAAKNERRDTMANLIPTKPSEPELEQAQNDEEEQPENLRMIDLEKWETKSLNRVKQGRPADCPFESEHIEPLTRASIKGALSEAESEEDVRAVFADLTWVGYP